MHATNLYLDLSFLPLPTLLGLLCLGYWASCVVYNLYFHPLASIPGPLWWRATRLCFIRSFLSGRLVRDVLKIHERYGEIVRIAPDEVSFADEDIWQAALSGRNPLPKNPTFFTPPPGQANGLLTASSDVGARIRQVMMPAFTERALSKQEPVIQLYAGLLVERLKERVAASSSPNQQAIVNTVDWFNWFTFDLVGELAFGESFECLENAKHHPWVDMIFSSIKAAAFAAVTRYYTGLETLLLQIIPTAIRKRQMEHYTLAVERIHQRMSAPPRDDFMRPMLENNPDFKKMTIPEIEATMSVLIIAGSETTATTLCGICNHLVQNPTQLKQLEQEIRSRFQSDKQITLHAIQNLPFLNAVIQEGLRLCNPVAGGLLRRIPKGGLRLCGHFLPEGTHVIVNSTAMSLSEKNFHRANEFLPERFLPESMRPAEFENDHRNNQKPFSLGVRSCIGKSFGLAEMRLVLARLVWEFDISMAQDKRLDWNRLKTYVMVQKDTIEIAIKKRDREHEKS
ncbi:cytochrome P450 [Daldinia caldariorum]|uniref:cytochrome P450 n=1 Tax=Daldinia caldariorum TaxID=326644 RepID=UPI002007FA3C|nr:cytochrome P450 [Daldinia caldariorum]KAI1463617.1 cytochrome P450 [Daldinia caldariorum]